MKRIITLAALIALLAPVFTVQAQTGGWAKDNQLGCWASVKRGNLHGNGNIEQ